MTTITGGGSSAVGASTLSACERFRGTDPLVTGVPRRALAADLGSRTPRPASRRRGGCAR